ncbi:MAG: rhodanese-like domain-containing protein [Fimbriimonadaceae bacterium]|nr:rhodanese-like domain-containing protein [Fimbriimonadaceae bacterium]
MAQAIAKQDGPRDVDAATLKNWLDADQAVLIDVREPAEFAAGHIPGALLLPSSRFEVGQVQPAPGKMLVLHCASGMRAGGVCEKLLAAGLSDVFIYRPGLKGWQDAGFAVEGTGRGPLPVMQQTQLTVGVMVLLGLALGVTVSQWFLLLPAMAGGGLLLAGATGNCPLANGLAKLPWNQGCGGGSCTR